MWIGVIQINLQISVPSQNAYKKAKSSNMKIKILYFYLAKDKNEDKHTKYSLKYLKKKANIEFLFNFKIYLANFFGSCFSTEILILN